jgi:glycosyltransferase involved in cell wall biosynthesis
MGVADCGSYFHQGSSPYKSPKILYIGRLERIKGVDVLLRAAEQIPEADLLIAGAGAEGMRLRKLAASLAVPVKFLGAVGAEEKFRLLAEANVFVLPSRVMPSGRTEGLPVTLLEAMQVGCPIVASRVGGVPEIVRDGVSGLLIPPEEPDSLSRAIRSCLEDRAAAHLRAERASSEVQAFHLGQVAETYRCLITKAAEKG